MTNFPLPNVDRRRALGMAGGMAIGTMLPASATAASPARSALSPWAVNVDTWWKDQPLERRIDRAAALGFDKIEIWGVDAPERDAKAIARQCRDAGLAIVQYTATAKRLADPGLSQAQYLNDVRRTLDLGTILDSRMTTVVGHQAIEGVDRATALDRYRERLAIAAPLAQQAGVTLIVEPFNPRDHLGFFLYGSEDALNIMRAIGSPALKINWDLFHMQRAEGDLIDRFRKGIDQIAYVQIGDSPGRNEPGTGEVDFGRVLGAVREAGYAGPIGLEFFPTKGKPDDTLREELETLAMRLDRSTARTEVRK
ncbi:TIM barrel protein [Sphingobium algorifonticola]|uniref:Hydroxypyruvate isomerase n=1 Tax=Sphingobium algorifonticola TaxID=2008318 RepID=A0A437J9V8_9SPHN|nr:TIM barrel protein [Sphingobium algorifonticola]RVT42299.1 hydroxypyruvate isomerase [Sphingobium algorifonticola]